MKIKLLFLITLLAMTGGSLWGQNAAPIQGGNISASSTNCSTSFSCVWESVLPVNAATTTINMAGTFSATLLVEESNNGGQSWATAATLSAVGTTTYSTNGFTDIRVRCSAFTSGTVAVTISTGLNTGLQGPPGPAGSSSGGGTPTSVTAAVGASNIMAEYQFLSTETCAAAVDYSGNSRNISSTVGVAPLIIAGTGGCNFLGNGALIAPAALNTAQAVTIYMTWFPPSTGGQVNNVPVGINGNGLQSNCFSINMEQFAGPAVVQNDAAFKVMTTRSASNTTDTTVATFSGTGVLTWSFGTTQGGGADDDKVWINGQHPGFIGTAFGLRNQTVAGAYQIGGMAAGSCNTLISYLTGKIYYVVFWANEPTDQQEAVARNFIVNAMTNRGVGPVASFSNSFNDDVYVLGDSISTIVTGVTQSPWNWLANNSGGLLRPLPNISNAAVSGYSLGINFFPTYRLDVLPYLGSTASGGSSVNDAINTLYEFIGTNDACSSAAGCQALFDKSSMICRDWRINGGNHCFVATMLSRTGNDAGKNLYDAVILNSWPIWFDQIADYAANPALGADGANASTNYFNADGIHPNQSSEYNIILPQISHIINQNNSAPNFSQGNKYAVTATAAVAVTAATESGNNMTFTATNAFTQGQCITVVGVTPAGYNTPANQCWTALTVSPTAFIAYNNTTGLGALTVAGTAAAPQEVDNDGRFSTLAQCVGCTHTLEPCVWHLGQTKLVKITSTSAWTITPWVSAETINGGATFTTPVAAATNQPTVRLDAIRGTTAAGGCTWSASLQ